MASVEISYSHIVDQQGYFGIGTPSGSLKNTGKVYSNMK